MFKELRKVKTKGFTLIEMLIVVIIIGILMYALLGNSGNADKNMEVQQKMDLVAKSFDQCLGNLDSEWLNIKQARTAMSILFGANATTPLPINDNSSTLWALVSHPKGMWYNIQAFKKSVEASLWGSMWRTTCSDFLNNLQSNVGAKWNTEVTFIPAWTNMSDIDENYGGFLLCATLNDRKYGEFIDKTKKNKFYTCAILNMWIGSTGRKPEVLQAFWITNGKAALTTATTPKIQN